MHRKIQHQLEGSKEAFPMMALVTCIKMSSTPLQQTSVLSFVSVYCAQYLSIDCHPVASLSLALDVYRRAVQ